MSTRGNTQYRPACQGTQRSRENDHVEQQDKHCSYPCVQQSAISSWLSTRPVDSLSIPANPSGQQRSDHVPQEHRGEGDVGNADPRALQQSARGDQDSSGRGRGRSTESRSSSTSLATVVGFDDSPELQDSAKTLPDVEGETQPHYAHGDHVPEQRMFTSSNHNTGSTSSNMLTCAQTANDSYAPDLLAYGSHNVNAQQQGTPRSLAQSGKRGGRGGCSARGGQIKTHVHHKSSIPPQSAVAGEDTLSNRGEIRFHVHQEKAITTEPRNRSLCLGCRHLHTTTGRFPPK